MAASNKHAVRTSEASDTFDPEALAEQAGKASALMGAMSNEKRLMILCQLVKREHSVNELAELLKAPQSTISQHLALLRREGFVQARRDAQTQFYSLAGEEARAILETLQALYCDPQSEDAER
jgi:DNA-binding transcriptional ArsR family regulator